MSLIKPKSSVSGKVIITSDIVSAVDFAPATPVAAMSKDILRVVLR